jgi:hypothetical protein
VSFSRTGPAAALSSWNNDLASFEQNYVSNKLWTLSKDKQGGQRTRLPGNRKRTGIKENDKPIRTGTQRKNQKEEFN